MGTPEGGGWLMTTEALTGAATKGSAEDSGENRLGNVPRGVGQQGISP